MSTNRGDMPAGTIKPIPEAVKERVLLSTNGVLFWSQSSLNRFPGKECGSDIGRGYKQVKFMGEQFMYHRIVFFLYYGYQPEVVDHIDGDVTNNTPENLRSCSWSQNSKNRKIGSTNTSGVTGVDYMKRRGVWRASYHHKGKKIHLGTFNDYSDAVNARAKAEVQYGDLVRFKAADALLAQLERTK